MMVAVIACVIGVLILVAGLVYLKQNQNDAESRTIYTVTAVIGAVIVIASLVRLFIM
ncbi:hypothetical protein [Brotaphodocola sp.]|uniref:hypothetical protein n=1 Tax=Brotaphodocola sp. TaxID=3073577 RepID=UPI003D7E6F86